MANKSGRAVPVGEFAPKVPLPGPQEDVKRVDGSDETAIAKAMGGLADEAGKWADEAARREGEKAGTAAGYDPAWRPGGIASSTIRGAAFEKAATSSALDSLDAKTRTGMTAAYQEHHNDPVALAGAFDKLRSELAPDVPELQGQFKSSFDRLRLPFQVKAIDAMETRQNEGAVAAALSANAASRTTTEMAVAANPDAARPVGEQELAGRAERRTRLVEQGALRADVAEQQNQADRREFEATMLEARAEKLTTADAVKTYRESVQKGFAEGKLPKLDADGYNRVLATLQQREQKLTAAGRQAEASVSGTFDQIVRNYAEGIPSSPAEVDAARTAATATPKGAELIRDFEQRMLIASMAKTKAPAELDAMADGIAAAAATDGRGLTGAEGSRLTFLRSLAEKKRQALGSDPLAHAGREGIVPVAPISVPAQDTAAGVASQMVGRVATAKAAATVQGTQVRYLTADDKATFRSIGEAGGDRALELVRGLVQGAGADAPALLRELGGDFPELAKVGDLLVNGGPGSDRTAREVTKALELRKVPGAKPAVPPKEALTLFREELGAAYINNPVAQQQAQAAAQALYEVRAQAKGITDNKSSDAKDLYREVLHAAAGAGKVGDATYGGVATYKPGWWSTYKVAVPATVRADRFRDVVQSIRDEDIPAGATSVDGKPITAKDVRAAIPVRVKGGYSFALGDPTSDDPKWLGRPGAPLVLDVEAMTPKLRARVPGAFLGGEH